MTEREKLEQVAMVVIERELETPDIVTGIPGVCMTALAAPNCILVAQWVSPGDPYVYCLS